MAKSYWGAILYVLLYICLLIKTRLMILTDCKVHILTTIQSARKQLPEKQATTRSKIGYTFCCSHGAQKADSHEFF
jgi:hypothetical protein